MYLDMPYKLLYWTNCHKNLLIYYLKLVEWLKLRLYISIDLLICINFVLDDENHRYIFWLAVLKLTVTGNNIGS